MKKTKGYCCTSKNEEEEEEEEEEGNEIDVPCAIHLSDARVVSQKLLLNMVSSAFCAWSNEDVMSFCPPYVYMTECVCDRSVFVDP